VDGGAHDAREGGLPATITDGLVLHVTFDEGLAQDARGNHDGGAFTVSNLAASADRFGRPTGAARFQPSPPGLVQVSPHSLPLGAASRTLALWVKPRIAAPAPGARAHSNVFAHWGIDDCQAKMFGLGHPANKAFGWSGCEDVSTSLAVTVAQWTFVAATYDGSTMTVWANEQKTARAGVTLATTQAPLAIGGERKTYGNGFDYYLDGDLDDLRVWTRALTEAELTALARER